MARSEQSGSKSLTRKPAQRLERVNTDCWLLMGITHIIRLSFSIMLGKTKLLSFVTLFMQCTYIRVWMLWCSRLLNITYQRSVIGISTILGNQSPKATSYRFLTRLGKPHSLRKLSKLPFKRQDFIHLTHL